MVGGAGVGGGLTVVDLLQGDDGIRRQALLCIVVEQKSLWSNLSLLRRRHLRGGAGGVHGLSVEEEEKVGEAKLAEDSNSGRVEGSCLRCSESRAGLEVELRADSSLAQCRRLRGCKGQGRAGGTGWRAHTKRVGRGATRALGVSEDSRAVFQEISCRSVRSIFGGP